MPRINTLKKHQELDVLTFLFIQFVQVLEKSGNNIYV